LKSAQSRVENNATFSIGLIQRGHNIYVTVAERAPNELFATLKTKTTASGTLHVRHTKRQDAVTLNG